MRLTALAALGMIGVAGLVTQASADTFLRIDSLRADDLKVTGFEIKQQTKVDVEAVGIFNKYSNDDLTAYAWILDSKSREVVWDMRETFASRVKSSRHLLKADETITLSPGKYELYYFAGAPYFGNVTITNNGVAWNDGDETNDEKAYKSKYGKDKEDEDADKEDEEEDNDQDDEDGSWVHALANLFVGDDKEYSKRLGECYVTLSSASLTSADVPRFAATGDLPGALILHTKLGDEEAIQDGFALSKPSTIHIYAVVEYPDGYQSAVDQVWIMNEATRERVWEIDKRNTRWAGGADKNRVFDNDVSLPAGKYVLQIYTDDSHSYEHFNAQPPYDPLNWGVTILPGRGFEASAFSKFTPGDRGKALVEMTRVRDDEDREKFFHIGRRTNLRIFALGEFDKSDRSFADYGWIENAGSSKIVWQMDRTNTEFAGGAHKNRMFDGQITLDPGDYRVAYVSDGSHAYRSWNASAPYEPNAWGITIYPGEGYQTGDLKPMNEADVSQSGDVLVSMVRVRDNQDREQGFTLSKPTKVRVYAIGEGVNGEMADYGYIINKETGRTVWEMTWRNTTHAGGAEKNRMYDEEITLDPGKYEAYFITDGSHAYNDWNDSKPRDPNNWGITISMAKN